LIAGLVSKYLNYECLLQSKVRIIIPKKTENNYKIEGYHLNTGWKCWFYSSLRKPFCWLSILFTIRSKR